MIPGSSRFPSRCWVQRVQEPGSSPVDGQVAAGGEQDDRLRQEDPTQRVQPNVDVRARGEGGEERGDQASDLGIHILWLPTYAPWTNPIEKLWRWLRQEVIHCHRRADHWEGLKAAVTGCLDAFADGSTDLLRYVGLLPD